MNTARRARETALQALYQCESLGDCSSEAINLYFERFHTEEIIPDAEERSESRKVAESIIQGVLDHSDQIDEAIQAASKNWKIERMSRVERNILRVGTYELLYQRDIPESVVINEALEVTKSYSNQDAVDFVNGVLDGVAKGRTSLTLSS